MAQPAPEASLVADGITTTSAVNGSFVQNMYYDRGCWEVRKGFGQIAQYDSTLSKYTENVGILQELEGLSTHLGSYLMETRFGHEQIISVFEMVGWTNNLSTAKAERLLMYSAQIYDITTNENWEEILTNTPIPSHKSMPWYKGNFEESTPLVGSGTADHCVNFVEKDDILYFSHQDLGTFCYKPGIFRGNRGKTLGNLAAPDSYCDNSLIKKVALGPNLFYQTAGVQYYEFLPEAINVIASLGRRLLYASDTRIYVSDENKYNSVTTSNVIDIPTDNPITAMVAINRTLMVFSEKETFLVQPPNSFELNSANVTKISSVIGCTNSNTICKRDNAIVWTDRNGIYTSQGTLEISSISEKIRSFFHDFMPNPLSFYLRASGWIPTPGAGFDQPDVQNWYEDAFASLHYNESLKLLFLNVPAQNITLCQSSNGEWSLWNWRSSAAYNTSLGLAYPSVYVRTYMDCRYLVSSKDSLYAIGLDSTSGITTDKASTWNSATSSYDININRDQKLNSYFITQYGRGGGVDRSTEYEDYRFGIGEWSEVMTTASPVEGGTEVFIHQNRLIFDEPIFLEKEMTAGYEGNPADVLIPVVISQNSTAQLPFAFNPLQLRIKFKYDSDHWDPVTAGLTAAGEPICLIEASNISSFIAGTGFYNANWTMVAGDYLSQLGTAATRDEIQIDWSSHQWNQHLNAQFFNQLSYADNVAVPGSGVPLNQPSLPLALNEKVTLFYIPFKRLKKDESVSKMNIHSIEGFVWYDTYAGYPTAPDHYEKTNNYVFEFSSLGYDAATNLDMHYKDSVAQGVDWCYASQPIGLDTPERYKARGVYSNIKSQNIATNPIANGWGTNPLPGAVFPRVFNTTVSADNNQWNSQVIDYTSSPPGIKQSEIVTPSDTDSGSIITKIRNTANVMKLKIFGDTDLVWGQAGTDNGNVLVDDQQFGTIADSNSTRGSWVNWMFFGYILDKSEGLILKSAKAAMRTLGGRRRRGQ